MADEVDLVTADVDIPTRAQTLQIMEAIEKKKNEIFASKMILM